MEQNNQTSSQSVPPVSSPPENPNLVAPRPKSESALPLIIAATLSGIALLLTAGYIVFILFFQNTKATTTQTVQPVTKVQQPTPTPDPTTNWESYTSPDGEFSIQYPPDWKIGKADTHPSEGGLFAIEKPIPKEKRIGVVQPENESINIYKVQNKKGLTARQWVQELSREKNLEPLVPAKDITVGGKSAVEVVYPAVGDEHWVIIPGNGYIYLVFIEPYLEEYNPLVIRDQILSTLKLGAAATSQENECKSTAGIYKQIDGPFSLASKGGKANVTGKVITKNLTVFDEPLTLVYLDVKNDNSDFYKYYQQETTNGNGVNGMENNSVLFKLGQIENGKYSTSSNISKEATDKITSSLQNGNEINLKLEIPIYVGAGAPPNFTFACNIQ